MFHIGIINNGEKEMGELIKKYGTVDLKGKQLEVELNEPIHEYTGGIVHLQSEEFRMEMSQLDFYKLVGCINLAKENLKRMKGSDVDE